jgi:hypothetical protein
MHGSRTAASSKDRGRDDDVRGARTFCRSALGRRSLLLDRARLLRCDRRRCFRRCRLRSRRPPRRCASFGGLGRSGLGGRLRRCSLGGRLGARFLSASCAHDRALQFAGRSQHLRLCALHDLLRILELPTRLFGSLPRALRRLLGRLPALVRQFDCTLQLASRCAHRTLRSCLHDVLSASKLVDRG